MIKRNLEEDFGVALNHDFKLFQKLIELNNPIVTYYDPKENFSFRLTKWLAVGDTNIKIDEFFNYSDMKTLWSRHLVMWRNLDYLPIGSLLVPYSGLLLYCNIKSDLGKVYYTENGLKEPLYLISNLFDLLESFKIEYRDDMNNKLINLYKNWNEDFWRLRESQSE